MQSIISPLFWRSVDSALWRLQCLGWGGGQIIQSLSCINAVAVIDSENAPHQPTRSCQNFCIFFDLCAKVNQGSVPKWGCVVTLTVTFVRR